MQKILVCAFCRGSGMPFTGGERPVGEHSTAGSALVHHRTTQTCHSRGAKRRGNLAEPGWIAGYSRRKRNCLPEIAPQGHFLALRAQGATGAERPRNDRAGGLPEAQKIRGCDLQSRRFFGFDQALPAQPRTSLSLCSTRALMLARAGLRYWRGSK